MFKTVLVFLVIAVACVAGNPAAGAKVRRWKTRLPTVSPNIKGLPFKKVIDSYTPPIVRIPGTKTVENCGPVKPHSRIVGGEEAIPHSYPWQVGIFFDDRWFCGGIILNEEWVLTAAHCMHEASSVEVTAGYHYTWQYEDTEQSISSHYFFTHEHYVPYLLRNDIALINLPQHWQWSDAIAPVCLPSRSAGQLANGTLVSVAGWGAVSESSSSEISTLLNEVVVPVMDTDQCRAFYGGIVPHKIICTYSTGGKGICTGDCGGALNYVEGGVTYARGIASFTSAAGCESGDPDGFTNIVDHLDWIETNTGIAIDD